MNALLDLINAAFSILIIGAVVHWIMTMFFQGSFNPEVIRVREFLDKIYNPFLDNIRQRISPLTLSDGRMLDLSPMILLVGLWLAQRLVSMIFGG